MKFFIFIALILSITCSANDCDPYKCTGPEKESLVVQKWPDVLTREGKILKIKLTNGEIATLTSSDEDWKDIYEAVDYWKDFNFLLVLKRQYSGEVATLFVYPLTAPDAFEKPIKIDGWPVLSPNRKRLAVFGFDIEAGWSYNGVAVYSINSSSLHKEIEIKSNTWGVTKLDWVSDSEILISTQYWRGEDQQTSKSKLILENSFWQIH